jgi:hypothetical protein
MILGVKGFPVNPNTYYPDFTEADNPYLFNSLERAKEFIEKIQASRPNLEDEVWYFNIVELIEVK